MQEADHIIMDTPQREPRPSQYIQPYSNPRQAPLRVNPKYPLQSSIPVPQNMPRSSLPNDAQGNGMARTTSRRRRISGSGQDRVDNLAQPAVSKAPTFSNTKSPANGSPNSPTTNNLASFAARARAAPSDLVPASIPKNELDPSSQSTRPTRRSSINRPPGAVYSEIRGTERKQFSSPRVDPNSPQFSSNATTPRQNRGTEPKSPQQTLQDTITPKSSEDNSYSQARSEPRRASTGVTGPKAEWAADRSPLQKLEVKFSKEEKRARAEEAERQLRESQLAEKSRKPAEEVDPLNRRQSRRVSADSGGKSRMQKTYHSPASNHQVSPPESQSKVSGFRGGYETEQLKDTPRSDRQRYPSGPSTVLQEKVDRHPVTPQNQKKPVDSPDLESLPERGVRFQNTRSPPETNPIPTGQNGETSTKSAQRSLRDSGAKVPTIEVTEAIHDPQDGPLQESAIMGSKFSKTVDASNSRTARTGNINSADEARVQTARSKTETPNHRLPTQVTSTMQSRKSATLDNDSNGADGVPTQRRHHLSDILHHGRLNERGANSRSGLSSGRLDEWRQGGTARLTSADLNPSIEKPASQNAWWEKGNSNEVVNSNGIRSNHSKGSHSVDSVYNEGYGKRHFLLFSHDKTLEHVTDKVSPDHGPAHVRPYIGNAGDTAATWKSGSGLSYPKFRSKENPHLSLSTTYSYSCPQLAEHDNSHPYHICKPYMSKELTQSMRSIRIRAAPSPTSFNPPLYLKCGPLLRYTGLKRDRAQESRDSRNNAVVERETWRGSVMIVTMDADSSYSPAPVLRLFPEPIDLLSPPPPRVDDDDENGHSLPSEYIDPIAGLPKLSRTGKTIYVKPVEDLEQEVDLSFVEDDGGLFEETRTAAVPTSYGQPNNRPRRDITSSSANSKTKRRERESLPRYQQVKGVKLHAERGVTFWRFNLEVELGNHQARIAYRINNSASVGFWVPARGQSMNVMFHSCNGFSMSVNPASFSGPDPLWRDVLNSHQTRPFHVMIGGGDQIYNDAVMSQTTLFQDWLSIKNPHHKHEAEFSLDMQEELEVFYLERYSMWFSQGLFGMTNSQIPMINLWDDHDIIDGFGSYPHHFMSTPVFCGVGAVAYKYYMLFQHQSVSDELTADEPSWLLGASPGPYIKELSRSVFMLLGKSVAFLGLDCRTERMREEILSEASYELVLDRCRREIVAGETKHLIVLLGVPIAYPRLVWLENLLTSRVMDPIKALSRVGMLGGFLNKFDGGVEILDDLDDHWTAKNHKHERNCFVQELQSLAAEKSVRITILGGDVHLAAVGQFYSNPKLNIPKDQDHRYMANVISSAIVNTPPPEMMVDILNKRNKIHHLDPETDESMIPMFTHDVDGRSRNNRHLLPRRNWCSIREYYLGTTPPPTPPLSENSSLSQESIKPPNRLQRTLSLTRNDVKPGNLIRRLSGRDPRPSKDYPPSNEYRSSSTTGESSPPRPPISDGYFTSQHSPSAPASNVQGKFHSPVRYSSAPLPRPGNFHRRPTNMSEKAVAKGGNDYEDGHISLEHGLDIVINCEVNQKDPAGITVPYRLLIPALWYNGEGDPNDIRYRKQSWIKRLGSISVGRRKGSMLAKRQGQGNWGGSLSEDSQSESDGEGDVKDVTEDFQPVQRSIGGSVKTNTNGLQLSQRAPRNDFDDEPQGFQSVQWRAGRTGDDRYDSPQGRRGTWRHDPQERRASKVDDMLGMAGPAENGTTTTTTTTTGGRGVMSMFEHHRSPRTDLGRTQSARGYGGIDAYKESRWRGLLRRKD